MDGLLKVLRIGRLLRLIWRRFFSSPFTTGLSMPCTNQTSICLISEKTHPLKVRTSAL